ncbi:MAG: rod shape-determining protein MreC [Chloroflexi bacterium]|jgi:rod shape-determining protein MreC|nr:rod shape-determining protein MreC [Chloroflexota bacterium]
MDLNEAQKRIRWATFAVLAVLAVLLTILDRTGNLDTAFGVIRNPMASIMGWTSARTYDLEDVLEGPRDLETARNEIALLQDRIDTLERENEELREIEGEYQLLLDLFNRARQAPDYQRLTASVIGQDSNQAVRSIIVDKGSADGVRVGMPVESSRGLVGQVFRTTPNSSQAVIISDSSSAVPARLGNSRATGILRGGGVGGSLTIDWIDLKHQLQVGEVVLTSGLGGRFPQDLVIGRVIEVDRREAELFQRAIVQPAVDFDSLEVLFVVTDFEPVDTEIFNELQQ